jgi:nucleotide-binding universal stress UspA family protein
VTELALYTHILVAVEHSPADATILTHVRELARLTQARVLLLHVADGWAARAYDELALRESEEMRDDRAYLEDVAHQLAAEGIASEWRLGRGDPATEIIAHARKEHVDLVAMATHGHRLINDLLRGTTVNRVRHELEIPVLLLKARAAAG